MLSVGDLGEGLGGDLPAAAAYTKAHEELTAEGAERDGEAPVKPDPPRTPAVDLLRLEPGLVGAVVKVVLEEVVVVALLENPQHAPQRKAEQRGAARERERDLEVDQPGAAFAIDEDVLPFVEIDMSDVAGVNVSEERGEAGEEVVVDALVAVEDMPFDELPGEGMGKHGAIDRDGAEVSRDADDPGESGVEVPFPGGETLAEPGHRDVENRLPAVELAQGLTGSRRVDRRRCPGVVLEDLDPPVLLSADLHRFRWLGLPEGSKQRGAGPHAPRGRPAGSSG